MLPGASDGQREVVNEATPGTHQGTLIRISSDGIRARAPSIPVHGALDHDALAGGLALDHDCGAPVDAGVLGHVERALTGSFSCFRYFHVKTTGISSRGDVSGVLSLRGP